MSNFLENAGIPGIGDGNGGPEIPPPQVHLLLL